MTKTRYEEYLRFDDGLPFVLHIGIRRTPESCVNESNWHENPEIQLCTKGSGFVLLDGVKYPFRQGDLVAVDPDTIHYTYTEEELEYTCLIFDTELLNRLGIRYKETAFKPLVADEKINGQIGLLQTLYADKSNPYRTAELIVEMIQIAVALYKEHSSPIKERKGNARTFERVKETVRYLREHYSEKISLDRLAQHVLCDKYSLTRDFKKVTGQTIVGYLNRFRCQMAARCLKEGYGVAQAAYECGFDHMSFFSKTFKRYCDKLPSEYKKSLQ